jgi:hypothetical protein
MAEKLIYVYSQKKNEFHRIYTIILLMGAVLRDSTPLPFQASSRRV